MDKVDLIYDTVKRIEDQNLKRFNAIEKDVADLKKFKNTLIGYCGGLTLLGTLIIDSIKTMFR